MTRLRLAAAFVLLANAACAETLSVDVVTASVISIPTEVALTGVLQAVNAFPVAFAQGGRLISVQVQEGAAVVAGQELARVDPTQADAALRAALANLQGADAGLRAAEQANDRAQGLLKQGAGTRADLDNATKTLIAAQATHDQATAQAAKARTAQDNTVLRAPRDGTVTARLADPGDVANPGQKILTMAATGGLEGVFNAPDGVDLEAFLGSPVTMTPIDHPDLTLNAKITEVSPLVDAHTGAVVVKAKLDAGAPAGVVFGTAVVGRLQVPQPAAITLPWTALTSLDGKPAVWTVDPSALTVTQVPVSVSAYGGDVIVVSGGVQAGEIVVTDGSQLLYPGRHVAIIAKGQ
jgi:hypothetical protein